MRAPSPSTWAVIGIGPTVPRPAQSARPESCVQSSRTRLRAGLGSRTFAGARAARLERYSANERGSRMAKPPLGTSSKTPRSGCYARMPKRVARSFCSKGRAEGNAPPADPSAPADRAEKPVSSVAHVGRAARAPAPNCEAFPHGMPPVAQRNLGHDVLSRSKIGAP